MKNLAFGQRLGFAANGILTAWKTEASFRFQLIAGGATVAFLAAVGAAPFWWALILLTCAAVLGLELVNTALEHLVDRLHPERHPAIKIAKDCAAGGVLLMSLASLGVFAAFLVDRF